MKAVDILSQVLVQRKYRLHFYINVMESFNHCHTKLYKQVCFNGK